MTEKEKKTRKPSEWNKTCAKVRKENPKMKASDVFKKAKTIYKK